MLEKETSISADQFTHDKAEFERGMALLQKEPNHPKVTARLLCFYHLLATVFIGEDVDTSPLSPLLGISPFPVSLLRYQPTFTKRDTLKERAKSFKAAFKAPDWVHVIDAPVDARDLTFNSLHFKPWYYEGLARQVYDVLTVSE